MYVNLMFKTEDIMFLALLVTIFTSIFIRVPFAITCNLFKIPMSIMTKPFVIETCSLNELFLVKMVMTFVIHKYTALTTTQFMIYIYVQEFFILMLTKRASMIAHPMACIGLFKWLKTNYSLYTTLAQSFDTGISTKDIMKARKSIMKASKRIKKYV